MFGRKAFLWQKSIDWKSSLFCLWYDFTTRDTPSPPKSMVGYYNAILIAVAIAGTAHTHTYTQSSAHLCRAVHTCAPYHGYTAPKHWNSLIWVKNILCVLWVTQKCELNDNFCAIIVFWVHFSYCLENNRFV